MRRISANLVLLFWLWSYVAPVVLVTTEMDLPACCRSHGKHHCSCCMAKSSGDAAPALRTNSPQCPCHLSPPVVNGSAATEAQTQYSQQLPSAKYVAQSEFDASASLIRTRHSGRSPPLGL
jgi:hypothetical protein